MKSFLVKIGAAILFITVVLLISFGLGFFVIFMEGPPWLTITVVLIPVVASGIGWEIVKAIQKEEKEEKERSR